MPYTDPSDKQSYEQQVIEKKLAYSVQAAKPGIAQLAQGTPIVGTWDDHDYGGNGSGDRYQWKQQSKQLFLDFMGHLADSTVRQRDGIYSSYLIGEGTNRVNLILLDLRWWRNSQDPLGEEQWAWLAQQLGVQLEGMVGSGTITNEAGLTVERLFGAPGGAYRLETAFKAHRIDLYSYELSHQETFGSAFDSPVTVSEQQGFNVDTRLSRSFGELDLAG